MLGTPVFSVLNVDKDSVPLLFEQGSEILKCGILKKKASHNVFRRWANKYVIITIGKLIWFPLPSGLLLEGDITITERMRKYRHEMGLYLFDF